MLNFCDQPMVKHDLPMQLNFVSPPCFLSTAIDLTYGGIYCFLCQDYIYDKDMEIIAKEEQRKAWKMQGWVLPKLTYLLCLLNLRLFR
jgi:hypothetical protein